MIKSNNAAHSTTVTKPAQSPVLVINQRQPQHSNKLTTRPPSPSVLPITWPAQSSVPMNKLPSNYTFDGKCILYVYYTQLTPREPAQDESSADTIIPSKPSHCEISNKFPIVLMRLRKNITICILCNISIGINHLFCHIYAIS